MRRILDIVERNPGGIALVSVGLVRGKNPPTTE
jgi:hypothetical protein